MAFRRWLLGCLGVVGGLAISGCDGGGGAGSGGGGGSGGDGGSGGATGSLAVPAVIGGTVEVTAVSADLVGSPRIAANDAGFAVAWTARVSGYLDGRGAVLPAEGEMPSGYFAMGAAALRSAEDGGSFGVAEVVDGGPFEDEAFSFSNLEASGQTEDHWLTDYLYSPKSLDIAEVGGKWYLVACLGGVMDGELRIVEDLESAPEATLDPLPAKPLEVAPDAACGEVRLVSAGGRIWGAYSAKVGGENAVFLQRFVPGPASEAVRVSEVGADAGAPHVLANGDGVVVVYREGNEDRFAVRGFDGEGLATSETALLVSDEDAATDFDVAVVGGRVVIATLGKDGARVQSFGLDGEAATEALVVGPSPAYGTARPAVAALGDVLGVVHHGESAETGNPHVYFTRVGGL